MHWSTSELRVRLAPLNRYKPSNRSKAVLLLWIFYFFLSCVCYAFLSLCLYVLCCHLLGKGWPLGSRLRCPTVSLSLSHWYPRSGVVLDCIDSWSLHPYFLWWFKIDCATLCWALQQIIIGTRLNEHLVFGTYPVVEQQRLRRACGIAQIRKGLRCSHTQSMVVDDDSEQHQNFINLLNNLHWHVKVIKHKHALNLRLLTPTILVTQVRESPDISQTDSVSQTTEEEVKPPSSINQTYPLRSCNTGTGISRHFPDRQRIPDNWGRSQTSQSSYLVLRSHLPIPVRNVYLVENHNTLDCTELIIMQKYHCLFVWFDSLRPINNLSVIKGQVFLGWTASKLGLM